MASFLRLSLFYSLMKRDSIIKALFIELVIGYVLIKSEIGSVVFYMLMTLIVIIPIYSYFL